MKSRGLLINSLATYILDTEEKKDLLEFVEKNNFNDLTFYTSSVLPTYDLQLALLISECRAIGVKKTGIAIGSTAEADRVFTFMDTFPGTIVDSIWIEYEFWNNEPRDFSVTQSLVEYIRTQCPRTIELGCYIGNVTEEEMLSLSNLVDRIFVHRYTADRLEHLRWNQDAIIVSRNIRQESEGASAVLRRTRVHGRIFFD